MGSIVTDVFSKTKDLTKAVVLVPGQAVLFFGRGSQDEGIFYQEVLDIAFQLSGDVIWIGRPVAVEVTTLTVQEGCRAVMQATVENPVDTRELTRPCQHHIIHQP